MYVWLKLYSLAKAIYSKCVHCTSANDPLPIAAIYYSVTSHLVKFHAVCWVCSIREVRPLAYDGRKGVDAGGGCASSCMEHGHSKIPELTVTL